MAVSIGMMTAARLSEAKGMLTTKDVKRLENLLERFSLPTRLDFDADQVMDALARDKKRQGDHIHFVLLSAIGKAVVAPISLKELSAVLT
jgi:3-dehydroquinate synthase